MGTPYVGARAGQLTVEQAIVDTLTTWLPTYIVAAARRYGIDEQDLTDYIFPWAPRGITVAKDFDDWPVNALPHIQVLSPGWTVAGGDDTGIHIKYQVQVVCLVGAQNQADTRMIRACYEDAIPGALMQRQSLGGISAAIDMVGGGGAELDQVSEQDAQTFQGSIAIFEVLVMGVLDPRQGPAAPGPLPPGPGDVPPVWPQDPTVIVDGATVELDPLEGDG